MYLYINDKRNATIFILYSDDVHLFVVIKCFDFFSYMRRFSDTRLAGTHSAAISVMPIGPIQAYAVHWWWAIFTFADTATVGVSRKSERTLEKWTHCGLTVWFAGAGITSIGIFHETMFANDFWPTVNGWACLWQASTESATVGVSDNLFVACHEMTERWWTRWSAFACWTTAGIVKKALRTVRGWTFPERTIYGRQGH